MKPIRLSAFRFYAIALVLASVSLASLHAQAIPPKPEPKQVTATISGEQAWEAYRTGALFLDARPCEDHLYGHIPGALNLPVWDKDFETRWTAFLAGPMADRRKRIIVYCKGCCSTDSLLLARRLEDAGFKTVQVYRDGYPGWARANHPKTKGDSPNQTEVK